MYSISYTISEDSNNGSSVGWTMMEKGDLSNEVTPKILLVFEGIVGTLNEANIKAFEKECRKGKWLWAVNFWVLNDLVLRKIWDIMWRRGQDVEIVTYYPQEFADAIEYRLDEEEIPFRSVWSTTPAILSRKIALMPDVAVIFDPDPAHQFTYGSKGRVYTSPHDL